MPIAAGREMTRIVLTGGLAEPGLARVVLGEAVVPIPVHLVLSQGGALDALLVPEAGRARVEFFAAVTGLTAVSGIVAGEREASKVYAQVGSGDRELALANLVMQAFGVLPQERVRARIGSLGVAAASRMRAVGTAGRGIRKGAGEVRHERLAIPHAGFFALEEHELRFRRFDGTMSPPLRREVFVAGDAVTVLPYDPVRDRVLVVEQMRMGPYGRGDPLPWQLEAIAGRIDPGEAPEDCARREAVEEAGLALGRLEKVAEYYPTPGAVTEYLYSYVAVCDLPDGAAGVFGVADEAEDICGHLLGFDALMALVAGGEVANAPLILTALWLQRERGRLRTGVAELAP
jgi:ADP-ribose pyrophosphatase